jgi:hypothetical protein
MPKIVAKTKKQDLVENLGSRGEKILENNISQTEKVSLKLKGAHGEALVLTDKRLYILKWGYMVGSTFGGRCLGFHFNDIMGVELRKGFLTGIVEILTPATQNTHKSYWGKGENSAIMSDNAVSFARDKFSKFQEAVAVVREVINQGRTGKASKISDYDELEKLAQMKDKGVITKVEFEAKKKQILGL